MNSDRGEATIMANPKHLKVVKRGEEAIAKWQTKNPGERLVLSNAYLSNANLSNANLSNANLSNANLSNANLCNANLCNADLSDADLKEDNLIDANLRISAEINYRNGFDSVGRNRGYSYACRMQMSLNGFVTSLSTLPRRWMSEDAGAGPRLKRDRWVAGGLLRSPRRLVCLSVPFVTESGNSNRGSRLLRGGNVGRERAGSREKMNSLRWLPHWRR